MTKANFCVIQKARSITVPIKTTDGELSRLMPGESNQTLAFDEHRPIASFSHALIFTPVISLIK
ncbi:MAG: hypothetical protein ACM3PP_06320 [Candidatus Saccharibacteria bacterium]